MLDTAIARMGGFSSPRAVARVRLEVITEWQRTSLDARPNTVAQGYQWSTELRDYTTPAWRSTRRFVSATGLVEIVYRATDSVAAVRRPNWTWAAQNVAYVDEREEAFAFSAERVIVLASDPIDARALPDPAMDGVRYARVFATVVATVGLRVARGRGADGVCRRTYPAAA